MGRQGEEELPSLIHFSFVVFAECGLNSRGKALEVFTSFPYIISE